MTGISPRLSDRLLTDAGDFQARDRRFELRRAAMSALGAVSVHDTQPWRWHLDRAGLRLHADYSRQLRISDPEARQLIISCGCALFNARACLAADGVGVRVSRLPSGAPDVLALIEPGVDGGQCPQDGRPVVESPELATLAAVANGSADVPGVLAEDATGAETLDALESAAAAEGARLAVARRAEQQMSLARLSAHAEAVHSVDPAYRAERRAWTRDDVSQERWLTGWTTPPGARTAADVPLVLCTDRDTPLDWLRCGEALQRLVLESARHGYTVAPVPHVSAISTVRARLRADLGLSGWPQMVLALRTTCADRRTGRRRRLVDVLDEAG